MELNKSYEIGQSKNIIELLKRLLTNNIVDSVVWFQTKKTRFSLSPKEVSNADELSEDFISRYALYNYDRLDSAANFIRKNLNGAKNKKVAVIAKPCDIRALIELHKLKQVNFDNIFKISLECPETINIKKLTKLLEKEGIDENSIVSESRIDVDKLKFTLNNGEKVIELKDDLIYLNCTRCPRKINTNSDLTIGEHQPNKWILNIISEKGKEVLEKINVNDIISGPIESENKLVNTLIEISQQNRESDFKKLDEMSYEDRFKLFYDTFKNCRKCGSCINACPICFCKDCDLQRKIKQERADKKAGIPNWEKMDRILFILTKMGHMCDNCIECGKCSQVCPVNIPSANFYRYINDKIQKKFDYVAGRDLNEMPPRSGPEIKKLLAALQK